MSDVIPEGWLELQVQDAFELGRGRVISKFEIRDNPGRYPVYSSQSKNDGSMGSISTYDFDGEFITWTTDGAYAGTVFHRQGKFNCTNVCGTLKDNGNFDTHPKFVAEYLSTVAKNHVSYVGNPKLMNGVFAEIPFLLPPLHEQQKIATILSSVDDMIEKTRAQIDKLKDLKTGMMQELLTQGIGHTEFKDSPVGRIPASWSECILQDIAVVQTGVAKNAKLTGALIEVPYLRVANVQDGYLDLTEIKTISIEASRLDRFLLRDEDVLVNEGGDFDKLGRGFIWRNQVSPCVHQNHVFVVRTNKAKLLPLFFNYLSGSEYGKKYYLGCAKQTTNLASLNSTQLKAFPILLPSVEEQKGICDVLRSFDEKLQQVKVKLDSLLILKKALMQDLLTGKVRVKLDSTEVAAA